MFWPNVLIEYNFTNLSYISLNVFKLTKKRTRWSFIDSKIILCALTYPFLYFANSWVFSLSSATTSPRTYFMTSFFVSAKSILFFHARKFVDPMILLLSLQNVAIWSTDWDIENNMILNFQLKNIFLDGVSNYLDSFKTFKETSMMPSNNGFLNALNNALKE